MAAIRLLTFTGARLNEILTLRWEYINVEHGILLLPDSKNRAKVGALESGTGSAAGDSAARRKSLCDLRR